MDWNEDLLRKSLTGKLIGHKLYYFPQTGSTNDEAFRLGVAGLPEGTAVIADSQTKGRGRMARVWHSPAGSNIYTSLILRPQLKPAAAPQISLVAGVAVAELLEQYCCGQVELKWPNDVLVTGKKICGILAQMKTVGEDVDFIVVGIGINVNIRLNQFPVEIRDTVMSLRSETGQEINRHDVIISLYENFAKWYKKLLQNGFAAIKEKWLHLAPMIGQDVQIMLQNEKIVGKALDLADDGSLIVLMADNEKLKISAGDATILKRGPATRIAGCNPLFCHRCNDFDKGE
jgi:BirA family transcriptional regulator, biotin operon repressor / biotin---[acetyl-CoA-carboxylase] ligase